MTKDLRQFLEVAKAAGPEFYVEVKKPVNMDLEPHVLHMKLDKLKRFPVMYFPKLKDHKMPLVLGVFGSRDLLAMAMDMSPEKVRQVGKAEVLHEFHRRQLNPIPVKIIPGSQAPVKEVVFRGDDVDLSVLPIPKHADLDSGRYITIGTTLCVDPDSGAPNAGIYRHEVQEKNLLGCMIDPNNHGAYIARRYAELGKPMEVVLFIGHHPATAFGSNARCPLGTDEMALMGGFMGEPLRVTKGETVDVPVPADAEIVIEGVIDPAHMGTDGPFAEFATYYGVGNKACYIIKVTAITMRKDAIYNDLTPQHREHNTSGQLAKEFSIYETVRRRIPTIIGANVPYSGRNFIVYVSLKKRLEGEGKLAGLLALGAERNGKIAVVVDDDVDVYDEEQVLWALATRARWDRGVSTIMDVLQGSLDPTTYDESLEKRGGMVTKVIIDATKPVNLPFETVITPPRKLWDSMKLEDYLD